MPSYEFFEEVSSQKTFVEIKSQDMYIEDTEMNLQHKFENFIPDLEILNDKENSQEITKVMSKQVQILSQQKMSSHEFFERASSQEAFVEMEPQDIKLDAIHTDFPESLSLDNTELHNSKLDNRELNSKK
ncbi:13455_t:CDS:2, partial [Racocetra fulgida]